MFHKGLIKLAKEDNLCEFIKGRVTGELFVFLEALIIGEYETVALYDFNEICILTIGMIASEFDILIEEISSSCRNHIRKIFDGEVGGIISSRCNKNHRVTAIARRLLEIVTELMNKSFERDLISDEYKCSENTYIGYSIRSWG